MGKNLHASAPSAPTYVWIRVGKKHNENDRTVEAVCGAQGGEESVRRRVVGWSFRAFLRDLLPKLQTFFAFFEIQPAGGKRLKV